MHPRLSSALAALLVSGCGLISDGGAGERGLVRFSLVLDYAASADFSSPIAVNRTVLVALQHPKEGLLDDETFTELTLRVEGPDGKEVESVFPLGFAQYGVVLEEAGRHQLLAVAKSGEVVDSVQIRAEEIDEISVDETVRVTTTFDDGTDHCTSLDEMSLDNVVLHRNQTVEMFLVPRSKTAEPLLGLLALTAEGPQSVQLHSPLVGQGRTANALIVMPKSEMADTLLLQIGDAESDRSIEVSIPAANEERVLDCT